MTHTIGDTLSKRLLDTGWQSWSYVPYDSEVLIQIPQSIYAPKRYRSLPQVKVNTNQLKKPAYGWCSWYAYGWDINEQNILKNAEWIASNNDLSLEYVLIDAGWAVAGDWLIDIKKKFPNGLEGVSKRIKDIGLKTGIWIAPFMVDPWSDVAKNHPDWLIKKDDEFVDGFRLTPWDKYLPVRKWILDIKNKAAREYLFKSIDRLVNNVGVNLLKLDFLYSIYYDPDLTIDEADKLLSDFLNEIKVRYPDVYTIGCGCPLIPAVNTVDSMRLGSDMIVSPFVKFLPLSGIFDSLYMHDRVTRTLRNRMWMKHIWNIDPDAFVCRPTAGLSKNQVLSCQEIIIEAEGNIFLGDDLTRLSQNRIDKYIKPLFQKKHNL